MDFDNLSKIRAQVSIYTNKKTSNILDGDFRSIYRGRSLDFDDLREYAYGDNIKDIDWKSSSKTGKTLVRRFVAEKKHNVLFLVDSGEKMLAHTSEYDEKSEVAINSFGTIAYLVDKHGDDFALMQNTAGGVDFSYFRNGAGHFENLMNRCRENIGSAGKNGIAALMDYVSENIRRKMIIIAVTDMYGMSQMTDKLLRKATVNNDILVICVDDAYLYGYDVYDVQKKRYEDFFTAHRNRLYEAEYKDREARKSKSLELFKRYGVSCVTIRSEKEIIEKVIELFERHRHDNIG